MRAHIDELLTVDISDESAYQLVNFMMDLALKIESHYFHQLRRYHKETFPMESPDFLKKTTKK